MKRNLALVPPADPDEWTERLRKEALARTIAGIGRTPPRADVKHYPRGHVWIRYPHEAMVLRVKEGMEI